MTGTATAELDEHASIRETIRAICRPFDDAYWRRCDEHHEFPWDFYRALAESGWIGVSTPAEYGGGGGGVTEASIVLEEIAASGAAMNGASAVHQSMFGMHPLINHGSEELRRRFLPGIASGEIQVAFGVTEPDAGTDTTSITTRASRDGEFYVVTGRKVWMSKALESSHALVLVRTTPKPEVARPVDGMTLLLVDLHRPEVRIEAIPKLGRNAVASCEVAFDDVRVPVSNRVGEEGRGFRYLLDGLNAERILIASEALGIGRVALRRAVAYAKERVVFGRPIGQNQGVAFPLAQAHARLHAAELVIRDAALRYDAGLPCGQQANLAKWLAADAAFEAADQAVQTHGGFGYAREFDVERYWREARLMRIAPISQEMVLNYVSEHVLALPKSY